MADARSAALAVVGTREHVGIGLLVFRSVCR